MSEHQARRAIREAHAAGRLGDLLREALDPEGRMDLADEIAYRCDACKTLEVDGTVECESCESIVCVQCVDWGECCAQPVDEVRHEPA